MQMLSAIDIEVRCQIQPFLLAGIQPDIVLSETERATGMLHDVTLPESDFLQLGNRKQLSSLSKAAQAGDLWAKYPQEILPHEPC